MEMRQIIGAAAFMAIALTAAPAAAQDYPYCLQGRQWGYPGNCESVQAGHHHKTRVPVSYIVNFPLILGIGY